MQYDRWIVGIGIQAKPTYQLYREVSHIVVHQVNHADNGGKRGGTLDGFKDGDCPQGTPLGDGVRSFGSERRVGLSHGETHGLFWGIP